MTPEEFRRFGHELIDWVADYRATVEARPVHPRIEPGSLRAQLPGEPPSEPQPFGEIMKDVERLILPALAHWQHPRFFGYFPSNGELSSVLGDYLSTGLGVLGLNWQASPALTELEEVATDWLRRMLGLADSWQGVLQDTASTSTLVALISARERASDFAMARGGLQTGGKPQVVYCSEQAHSSVDKAALLAGFGRAFVRKIEVDQYYSMRPESLSVAIESDLAQGRVPCAVVATTGTTTTTALDPIERIAGLTRRHRMWLHVDAAMAGSAMILPECRWMWQGIEGADSMVVNPHKWLGAAFDCSAYFVKDPELLVRVMSTNPSYLWTKVDAKVKNFRDWGIPLGRRFRALKLWCLIREQGVSGLQTRLRRDLDNAGWLSREIGQADNWRVLAPVPLQTLCVRHEPPGVTATALDSHTLAWCEAINRSGEAWLTPAVLDGRWMVRVSIGALGTEKKHVEALWAAMRRAAASSDASATPRTKPAPAT